MSRDTYENPLVTRYASREMSAVWSAQHKFSTWRRLWLALATAQQEIGLAITDEQLAEMRAAVETINFDVAEAKEKELRHDVMSHIHAYGEQCPTARPIIHLGATSCFVTDNTELLQIHESLLLLRAKLLQTIQLLRDAAVTHRALPTLGFTHYQPAQLTTVGKRIALWLQDFMLDFAEVDRLAAELPFRGTKGTTGTQASYLELFDGDHEKVVALDRRVAELMGMARTLPVTGQTYSRKLDYRVLATLSGIGQSAAKMGGDIRLLMNLREIDEPFAESQVGSSAMAYKRNPMRSERICALARYLMSLPPNAAATHAGQWFERTLDDSANRRIVLAEGCLAADAILKLTANVTNGLRVWPLVIRRRLDAELPFMATENILMACVKAGGDRQELHEAIRRHSVAAANRIKAEGADNDLLSRIAEDPAFAAVHGQLEAMLSPSLFIGRAPEQVDAFVAEEVDPVLAAHAELLEGPREDVSI
jgi:adenylosuccinate lyase